MKIINQSETKDERWYVGDVIEYGYRSDDDIRHTMIVRVYPLAGVPVKEHEEYVRYSTVMLDAGFDGDIGGMNLGIWKRGFMYNNLQDLKKEFLKACIYVKKVPFYGVIGKPEED